MRLLVDLWLWKPFQQCLTHVMDICAKFHATLSMHWIRRHRVTRKKCQRTTDGRTDNPKTYCSPPPPTIVSGGTNDTFIVFLHRRSCFSLLIVPESVLFNEQHYSSPSDRTTREKNIKRNINKQLHNTHSKRKAQTTVKHMALYANQRQ